MWPRSIARSISDGIEIIAADRGDWLALWVNHPRLVQGVDGAVMVRERFALISMMAVVLT